MAKLNENAITKIATIQIDLNGDTTPQSFYTVPVGKSLIVTSWVLRNLSIDCTTFGAQFGSNSPSYDNITVFNYTAPIAGIGIQLQLFSSTALAIINAGESLAAYINTPEGAPATIDLDVFGYLITA